MQNLTKRFESETNKNSVAQLGDLRQKFSRERSGQSVSLLNHLSKDCYPETVSCNVFSIKFAVI